MGAVSGGEAVLVEGEGLAEAGVEVGGVHAVEGVDGDVEVFLAGIPVVDELPGAAVDVPAGDDDVPVPDEVAEGGVDGGHPAVEVPGEVLVGVGAGFEVHDVVGEGDGGGVEEAGVDFEHEFLALEGVGDPFGAGEDVGGGAGDDGGGGEDGGDVVEDGVGAFGGLGGLVVSERLVAFAEGLLEVVEELGDLEAEEFPGVEEANGVGMVELPDGAEAGFPEVLAALVALVDGADEGAEFLPEVGVHLDAEVEHLLGGDLVEAAGGAAGAERGEPVEGVGDFGHGCLYLIFVENEK